MLEAAARLERLGMLTRYIDATLTDRTRSIDVISSHPYCMNKGHIFDVDEAVEVEMSLNEHRARELLGRRCDPWDECTPPDTSGLSARCLSGSGWVLQESGRGAFHA